MCIRFFVNNELFCYIWYCDSMMCGVYEFFVWMKFYKIIKYNCGVFFCRWIKGFLSNKIFFELYFLIFKCLYYRMLFKMIYKILLLWMCN